MEVANRPINAHDLAAVERQILLGDGGVASLAHGQHDLATAVLYLRVSTKDQAHRNNTIEGLSLPAQREACQRKAESLGAVVVKEFVERGETAKTAKRTELQRLLAFVKDNPVYYVIIHKVDRWARWMADDLQITTAIRSGGAVLVSCTEGINETPSGILLHHIMSAIAEYDNRNRAAEVMKGLVQKAKTGGTPGKAPLGYLNVRKVEDHREVRTVEVDPVRAPLVAWAFEVYATGEWTQRALLADLTTRGLDIPATRSKPAKPLSLSYIQYLLTNPYYKGTVRYDGGEYEGLHEPLVSQETWQRVQEVLSEKNETRTKLRKHPHYLKGIFCGRCGSRMIVTNARSRSGTIYPYFVCIGRHQKRNDCTMKAVLIDRVDQLIEEHYAAVQLPAELLEIIQRDLRAEIASYYEHARGEQARFEVRRRRLLAERDKLLQAHYADAIPLDLLKREQDRIGKQLVLIDERLNNGQDQQTLVETTLTRAVELARDCQTAYLTAPPKIRQLFNQAFFTRIFIDDGETIRSELALPFSVLQARAREAKEDSGEASSNDSDPEADSLEVAGLKEHSLVGRAGIEPATLGLRVPCSTS
jgi:site-specific DNA recombinase